MDRDELCRAMIAELKSEIADLQKVVKVLEGRLGRKAPHAVPTVSATPAKPRRSAASDKRSKGRKQAVVALLREKGAQRRGDIHRELDIPVGTLSTVLSDKTVFRSDNGKWHLIEQNGEASATDGNAPKDSENEQT